MTLPKSCGLSETYLMTFAGGSIAFLGVKT